MSLSNGSTAVTRITDHALQLAATDLEYEVTRVKSPVLGRDLNPMGRGDGTYYANGGNAAGGSTAIRAAKPRLVGESSPGCGTSVNNQIGPGIGGPGILGPAREVPEPPFDEGYNGPGSRSWRMGGW